MNRRYTEPIDDGKMRIEFRSKKLRHGEKALTTLSVLEIIIKANPNFNSKFLAPKRSKYDIKLLTYFSD